MTRPDLRRTLATIACTIVFSSLAVFGAIGPSTSAAAPVASHAAA